MRCRQFALHATSSTDNNNHNGGLKGPRSKALETLDMWYWNPQPLAKDFLLSAPQWAGNISMEVDSELLLIRSVARDILQLVWKIVVSQINEMCEL